MQHARWDVSQSDGRVGAELERIDRDHHLVPERNVVGMHELQHRVHRESDETTLEDIDEVVHEAGECALVG